MEHRRSWRRVGHGEEKVMELDDFTGKPF